MKKAITAMAGVLCLVAAVVAVRMYAARPVPGAAGPAAPSVEAEAAGPTASPTAPPSALPSAPPPDALFDQEFNGPAGAAPDPGVWQYDTGYGWDHGRTRQTYTSSTRNSRLDGRGHLVISALSDASAQGGHTSARLESRAAPFREGTAILVRARTDPYEPGVWPAVWTLGRPASQWPATGEVDVFEDWQVGGGFAPKYRVHTTTSRKGTLYAGIDPTRWHVYEARWHGAMMDFLVDGVLVDSQPYSARAASAVVADVALGSIGGTPAVPWRPFRLYVDYIRVVPA